MSNEKQIKAQMKEESVPLASNELAAFEQQLKNVGQVSAPQPQPTNLFSSHLPYLPTSLLGYE